MCQVIGRFTRKIFFFWKLSLRFFRDLRLKTIQKIFFFFLIFHSEMVEISGKGLSKFQVTIFLAIGDTRFPLSRLAMQRLERFLRISGSRRSISYDVLNSVEPLSATRRFNFTEARASERRQTCKKVSVQVNKCVIVNHESVQTWEYFEVHVKIRQNLEVYTSTCEN